jgi:glyoxylase I family protein
MIRKLHHIAIICSNYEQSKHFYTAVLGLTVLRETYRAERHSYKLDLALNGEYLIELFSFPEPPSRPTRPEAAGLRHLAFEVTNLNETIDHIHLHAVETEAIRLDELTGKRFVFIADPDGLPIEFYEG